MGRVTTMVGAQSVTRGGQEGFAQVDERYADICVASASASVPDTEYYASGRGGFEEALFEQRWSLVVAESRFEEPSQSQPHRSLAWTSISNQQFFNYNFQRLGTTAGLGRPP